MTTATQTFEGTYQADTVHSSFEFSVLHQEVNTFKGTLSDVSATLTEEDGELRLEGSAKPESISIREPEEFRAHVLGEEFFDLGNHPEVAFRSTDVELSEDGRARVEGELTIKGVTREVTAAGTYQAPRDSGHDTRAAIELETTFDRRDFGFDWQMELPNGGEALGWDVTLKVHLELVKAGA
jgi:polyisoprenoid-binding protein YceI